jgi:hypothetical protein
MKRIQTAQQLTKDATSRRYAPGTVVRRLDGAEVQLTSWPYFDGTGANRSARVMARLTVDDCRTNVEIPYFSCVARVRDGSLD